MKEFIHILAAFVFVTTLSTSQAIANTPEILPQNLPGDSLSQFKQTDSLNASKKICSCRLMEITSDSYEKQLVGFFAEKTMKGKKSTNYKILNEYIRREKQYSRVVFLETLTLKGAYKATNDCYSLYRELKSKNKNLRFYNIIDVDAFTNLAKR